MSYSSIRKTLLNRAKTLGTEIPIGVALPDVPYDPVIGQPYLEVVFSPNTPLTVQTGKEQAQQGFLQITVVYPRLPPVDFDPWSIVDKVLTHFQKGTRLNGDPGVVVRVNRPPWPSGPLPDEGWLRIPVSIPYFCMA